MHIEVQKVRKHRGNFEKEKQAENFHCQINIFYKDKGIKIGWY